MSSPAYGSVHRSRRKRLLAELARIGAAPCARCGQLMWPGQRLDLGHSSDEAKRRGLPGDRLEHAVCNRRAGQAITTAIQRARGGPTQRQLNAIRMKAWAAAAAKRGQSR